jgi:LysW-gamma-L-lysine carboxypeptidase
MASLLAPDSIGSASWTDSVQADIDLLHGLVSIESHSNREEEAVTWLREQMAARGMAVLDDTVGNAVATVGSGERHIVLLGHIDTVPGRVPVRIENGVLWGRGAVDAKGPLATFVAAASAAAADLNVRVTVVGAVGEEVIGSLGANDVATWDAPDFCIIGEPSGWDAVCLGYRGSLSLIYTLQQSTRHTAGPGESVAEEAVKFWNELRKEIDRWNSGARNNFGSIGHSLRALNTSGDGLTDEAKLSIGLRLPPDLDVNLLLERIRSIAAPAQIAVDGVQEGYRTSKQSKLVPPFLRAIREAGGTPRFTLKLGTSDMNVVGPVWQCPIVAYGPGESTLDHTPDERIVLSEYVQAVKILRSVLVSM